MAFTHYTPTAQRNYGVAYSYTTGIPTTSRVFSQESVNTISQGALGDTTESITLDRIQVSSYDTNGWYDSGYFSKSTNATNADNGIEYSFTINNTATRDELTYAFYLSTYETQAQEGEDYSSAGFNASDGDAANGRTYGATFSSVQSATTKFNSTELVSTTDFEASFTSSRSYTIQTGTLPDTGVSVVSNFGSSTSYSYLEYGETYLMGTDGVITEKTSISSSSGSTTVANTGTPIPPQSDQEEDEGENTIQGVYPTHLIATALSTSTFNAGYPSTVTTSKSISYSSSSSNLIETESSSYSVKTTTRDFSNSNYTFVRSIEEYSTEEEQLTEKVGRFYGLSTIHGGGAFISGGDTLDNGVITGATFGSTFSDPSVSQHTDFNTYEVELYQGNFNTANLDLWKASYFSEDEVDTIISASSELSIISTTSIELTETVDFGRLTSSAKVFTDITESDYYSEEGVSSGYSYYETTSAYPNSIATVFSGYTTTTFQRSTRYSAIDGTSIFNWISSIFTSDTYNTIVPIGNQNPDLSTRLTIKETNGTIQNRAYTDKNQGFSINYHSEKLITYDKGRQGGVQYEKSSDVSGAVRSTRSMTIADEVITSTTYTTPAATMNITGNTAESNSYTYSAGLALGLELKLNRYLTYFPHERYGDIVSSIDSMQYSYSDEGIGSSIIRFSSTGIYSTTKTGTAGSSLNTQSFSSELFGIVKPGLGAVYEEGQRTVLKVSDNTPFFGYLNPTIILGGQKFTDETGIFEYRAVAPPYSFYAFGSTDSSLITQNTTDVTSVEHPERSISLPANSVIFNPRSTYLYVGEGQKTYDRNQIRDFYYYYSSSYYYGPYPYY